MMDDRFPGWLPRLGGRGVVLNYHALSGPEMQAHIDVLAPYFRFIGLDQLEDETRTGPRARSKPFCLLTFDDGKRSNATEVAPVLHRLGVPAVFYVVTDFLSGDQPLWFDLYVALQSLALERREPLPAGLSPDFVKLLPYDLRQARLTALSRRWSLDEQALCADPDVGSMTWEEARILHKQGFTVGAHSVRHEVLTREPWPDAVRSIVQSIEEISERLATPCRTFAYPNGNGTPKLTTAARDAGATTVMSTEPRWVDASTSMLGIPRVQAFDSTRILKKISAGALRLVLTNPDGTGRTYALSRGLERIRSWTRR